MSRQPTRARPKGRPTRKKKTSIVDRILARIPLSHVALRRIATWTIVIVVLGGVYVAGNLTGINARVGTAIAEQVGKAGFRVDQIEVRGVKRMDVTTVYAVALDQKSRAMPLVDLNLVRDRLLQYGWVQDAHVSRRLPDTLLIRIVERTPAAVWQDHGVLSLIDRDGVYLEPVSADAMPDLPLVIGPGADRQEPAYQTLMVAAPALKPKVRAATWVGNRRWDLLFDSGEILSLPEGDDEAAKALKLFAEKDGTDKLLGNGYIKFDLRDPTRMVVRKPDPGMRAPAPKPSATAKPETTKSDRAVSRDNV
ncbi:cell division protein FtsQ/DivIB [Sphingomonas bacterium]|uniref:cell division protein FtsQ/DivIB n=1 Tax=Sphingomonas bacterium TaxID=1895847 RepID=UPI0026363E62|nr:cell division protein FtsQ/DivIB [Sphingomonas bacterium]MDB5678340.1 cell division protein FtsQ [Sphingomonas bacterium]